MLMMENRLSIVIDRCDLLSPPSQGECLNEGRYSTAAIQSRL